MGHGTNSGGRIAPPQLAMPNGHSFNPKKWPRNNHFERNDEKIYCLTSLCIIFLAPIIIITKKFVVIHIPNKRFGFFILLMIAEATNTNTLQEWLFESNVRTNVVALWHLQRI